MGNVGSALIEIQVGCLDTEGKCKDFVTLLPQSSLMTFPDSTADKNTSRTVRFMREKLSSVAAVQKWNCVRIVCLQPFNVTEQFGLSQITVFSQTVEFNESSLLSPPDTPSTLSTNSALSSPSSPASTSFALSSSSTPNQRAPLLSSLNKSAHPLKVLSKCKLQPKHPVAKGQASSAGTVGSSRRAVREGSPLNEFTGLEAQSSRLYHNAVRGIPHNNLEKETNSILLRVMAENEKYRKPPPVLRPKTPEERKLLEKKLPKFALSYLIPCGCAEFQRAIAKMETRENDCEMGEESGRKNKRRKSDPSPGCSESLTKKDIVPTVTSPAMQPFVEVPKRVGLFAFSRKNEAQLNEDGNPLTQEDCADVAILNRNGCIEDNGATHITSLTAEGSHLHDTEEMIPCPLCGIVLPQCAVTIHADSCVGTSGTMKPLAEVPKHVQPNAFSRCNEAQLFKDGIPLTQEGCDDMAILNTGGCNYDNGGPSVSQLTEESIRVHDTEEMIPCPLCGIVLPRSAVIIHAGSCVGTTCTSSTMQPQVEVPKHVHLNAFSRHNEAQLHKHGIPLTKKRCAGVAILNIGGCNEDNGGPPVTPQTAKGINIHDTEEMIPCPLCGIVLPRSAVIIHAGSCVGTSDTMQPLAEVPKHVQLNAFSRRNEAQLYKDGIPSTVKDCTDVAILNTNDCKKGVPHVTLQTTEGIHVHGAEKMMSCPLCGIVLPQNALVIHAGSCGDM